MTDVLYIFPTNQTKFSLTSHNLARVPLREGLPSEALEGAAQSGVSLGPRVRARRPRVGSGRGEALRSRRLVGDGLSRLLAAVPSEQRQQAADSVVIVGLRTVN